MTLRTTLAAAAAALCLTATAIAADPESGEVSPANPTVEWTGSVTEPTGGYELAVLANGSTDGTCEQPHCDTFTLKVPAGGSALTIKAVGDPDTTFSIGIEVEDPDGKITQVNDEQSVTEREAVFERPAAGDWIVRVYGTPALESFTYTGTATLSVPGAPAAQGSPPPSSSTPPPASGGDSPPPAQGAPAAQPSPAPAAGGSPSSSPAPRLTVRTGALRRLRKGRSFRAAVTTTAPLTRVTAVLAPAKKRTQVVASGRVARVAKKGSVRLKLRRSARRGRYVLVVSGIDAAGRRVIAQRTVTVR